MTLNVDVANNGTIVAEAYERREPGKSVFLGPAHDNVAAVTDELSVQVKLPTPTATFAGNVRGTFKFQKTVTLTGGTKSKVHIETVLTVPVGTSVADVKHACQKMIAFLDSDATISDIVFRGES